MVAEDDPNLSVYDVMDRLNVSRSYAYEIMAEMKRERLGSRCVRVRASELEQWRKEHEEECVSVSTSAETSGGSKALTGASPSASRRGAGKSSAPKRSASKAGGKGSSPTRSITVRTKPRSQAPSNDG